MVIDSEFNANDDLIEPFHQFIWRFFSCAECAKHFHDGILKRNMTAVVTTGNLLVINSNSNITDACPCFEERDPKFLITCTG